MLRATALRLYSLGCLIITENHPVVTITKIHSYDFFEIRRLLSLCASNIFSQKGTHQLLF